MFIKLKNIAQHVFMCMLILWAVSLFLPIPLSFKVWGGIALFSTYLVLAFGIKSTLGWFLLIAATLFCIASIWLDSIPLGFNIWLGAFLSMIYFSLATGGKYNTEYEFDKLSVCDPYINTSYAAARGNIIAISILENSDNAGKF
jgi:ABC-type transport system involved in multi-copper enzyme maturation permease subunit